MVAVLIPKITNLKEIGKLVKLGFGLKIIFALILKIIFYFISLLLFLVRNLRIRIIFLYRIIRYAKYVIYTQERDEE